jgi:hypothetical protein
MVDAVVVQCGKVFRCQNFEIIRFLLYHFLSILIELNISRLFVAQKKIIFVVRFLRLY